MKISLSVKYLIMLSVICCTGILLWVIEPLKIEIQIIAMVILCFAAIVLSEFDLLHPYFWFSSIFTIYSISYPILYKYGYVTKFGYSKDLMILQWLALSVFLIVVTPRKIIRTNALTYSRSSILNRYLINILCILVLVSSIIIVREGYANKKEIYSSGNIFLLLSINFTIILTIIYMYQLIFQINRKNKLDKLLIIKVAISIFIITMFTGERDLIFRFLVVSILILYTFNKINNKHLFLLTPLIIVGLPFSHIYKYFFLTGSITSSIEINPGNLFFEFLDGEFISASRNLQVLLNNSEFTKGLFSGSSILNDFIRIFYTTGFTHGQWYNDTFFPDVATTGYGFTLVGEGYVNWGYYGVILVFMVIGFFIRFLYLKSNKNIYFLVIYLYTVPIYMYSIRADLGNIFSPFIKHLLFSMLVIKLIEEIINKKIYVQTNSDS